MVERQNAEGEGASDGEWAVHALARLGSALTGRFEFRDSLALLMDCGRELLGHFELALLLADEEGSLRVFASTSADIAALVQDDEEGPPGEAFRTGEPVSNASLREDQRWPRFAASARAAGYEMVHAFPVRYRGATVGAATVFTDHTARLRDVDVGATQSLIDIATFAMLEEQALKRASEIAHQLQGALDSRLVIEQAKGVLSERLGLDVTRAFNLLREYCQNRNERISVAARLVVSRELSADEVIAGSRADHRRGRGRGRTDG